MHRTVVALITISVVLAGVSVGPAFAAQDDTAERTLNSCGTITEPGVYTLGSDLQNSSADACIDVETDDVVLDGAGHTIAGDGDGTGVAVIATVDRWEYLDPYTNVTVRNLRVTSLADGVVFVNTNTTTVTNLTATDVDTGVHAGTSTGYSKRADRVTIRNSTFVDVDSGVDIRRSVAPTVVRNDVRNFSTHGFFLMLTERATVVDNDVERPGRSNDYGEARSYDEAAIELSNYLGRVAGPYTTVADNDVDGGGIVLAGGDGPFPDTRVTNNDVEDGNIAFSGGWGDDEMENASIVGNEVTDGTISLALTKNVTVADNHIVNGSPMEKFENGVIVENGKQITVTGNVITDVETGVRIRGFVSDSLVRNNRITATDAGVEVNVDGFMPSSSVVRNNTVKSAADGVRVVSTFQPLDVVGNDLSDTEDAVHVYGSSCISGAEGAELVTVRDNDLAASVYGVHNDDPDVLNATGNDWGAADGPSSAADRDAPFSDPVTGDLADGDGSAVSERPGEPGVSNVHFAAAGDGNQTAA